MTYKNIKIIKKAELDHDTQTPKLKETPTPTLSQTVNCWVQEWRQQKQVKAKASYRQFFGDSQPLPKHS